MLLNTSAVAAFSHLKPYSNTTLTLESGTTANESGGTYVAYCWAEIEGYSKFGSYVGNASADGPFVYCGFKPAFVMTKRTDDTSNWFIFDSSRNSTNPNLAYLVPNTSDAESSSGGDIDFLSNGFKIRTGNGACNTNSVKYHVMAWARAPFKYSRAR